MLWWPLSSSGEGSQKLPKKYYRGTTGVCVCVCVLFRQLWGKQKRYLNSWLESESTICSSLAAVKTMALCCHLQYLCRIMALWCLLNIELFALMPHTQTVCVLATRVRQNTTPVHLPVYRVLHPCPPVNPWRIDLFPPVLGAWPRVPPGSRRALPGTTRFKWSTINQRPLGSNGPQ